MGLTLDLVLSPEKRAKVSGVHKSAVEVGIDIQIDAHHMSLGPVWR